MSGQQPLIADAGKLGIYVWKGVWQEESGCVSVGLVEGRAADALDHRALHIEIDGGILAMKAAYPAA